MDLKKNQRHLKASNSRLFSAPATASSMSASSKSHTSQSVRSQNWLNKETIKDLQDKTSSECHAAKQLYSPFLETEKTLVKEVEDYLSNKELADLRKKELLNKQWNDQVYEPIRKKILDSMNRLDWKSADYHKREMYRQFLEHVNKRGFVFLNDDDKKEYYAEALNPPSIKIKTKSLLDPLHTEKRQKHDEIKAILRCITGHRCTDRDLEQVRLPPLGGHRASSGQWLMMPNYIDNIFKNRNRAWRNSNKTNIDLCAWANAEYDAKVTSQEFQIPRKRMFKEHPPYGKPPVEIPKVPFIDPEDFADKIINTNPFPQHLENLRAENEAAREFFRSLQSFEQIASQEPFSQENKHVALEENDQDLIPTEAGHQAQPLENNY